MPSKRTYQYNTKQFIWLSIATELLFWLMIWQVTRAFGLFSQGSSAETLKFLLPQFAWFFLLIPFLIMLFYFQFKKRNKLVNKVESPNVLKTFLKHVSTRKVFWRYFLLRNAFVFIIFALMQPVLGTKDVSARANNVELIFAVDVSNSMNTRDIKGGETRLEVAKRVMHQVINQSNSSHVGLLIFAGNAYPQLPLTADKEAAKMYVNELNTNFISNQGTNIAAALEESSHFFSKRRTKKVLVLLTDGENHEGGLEEVYGEFLERNIEVLILGIGTEKGGVVPNSGKPNARSLKDDIGRAVISKVNLKMLEEIAAELDGEVLLSNESFPNVSQFLTDINKTSRAKTLNLDFKVNENRFQWPLGVGILLILILLFIESLPISIRNSNET